MRLDTPQVWFFLRGLVRESADWGDFVTRFRAAVPGARVFCLDLPGNGRYFREPAPLKLSQMLAATRAEAQKIRERENLVGAPTYLLALSLGAMVASEWLRGHPREISGAVLVNTSLRGYSPFYKRLSPAAYPLLARLFLTRDTRRREELILKLTSQRRQLPPAILDERVAARVERPVSRLNALRQIVAAGLSHPTVGGRPESPVLLLNSLGDGLVHPDCSERLRARWDVPMKRHAWAGHDLPLDDPDWVVDAVTQWLITLTAASGPALTKS